MRRSLIEIARCPSCRAEGTLDVTADAEDEREIREGQVRCRSCGEQRAITGGIVDLMADAPGFVQREAAGLDRFADLMRSDGWDRERILRLPNEPDGYWYAQATGMQQLIDTVSFCDGERILDVGSNTCWASAKLAEQGLDVIALDINAGEMQGLATADWWFDAKDVFFERVLGVMFDLPLASNSLDYVFCCEVLHHNHRANLTRTFAELHRVLKPGGKLLVINETLRSLMDPKLDPGKSVAEFEGHEHAYVRSSYTRAARAAGFDIELLLPRIHAIFGQPMFGIGPQMSVRGGYRAATAHAIRSSPRLSAAYLAWRAYVKGNTSLYMIGTKD